MWGTAAFPPQEIEASGRRRHRDRPLANAPGQDRQKGELRYRAEPRGPARQVRIASLSDLIHPSACATTASRSARCRGAEALDLIKASGIDIPAASPRFTPHGAGCALRRLGSAHLSIARSEIEWRSLCSAKTARPAERSCLMRYFLPMGIVTMIPGALGGGCWLGLWAGSGVPGTVPGVTIPGRMVV
jgi:hypothetical protein